jgi:hypothetical protein
MTPEEGATAVLEVLVARGVLPGVVPVPRSMGAEGLDG